MSSVNPELKGRFISALQDLLLVAPPQSAAGAARSRPMNGFAETRPTGRALEQRINELLSDRSLRDPA